MISIITHRYSDATRPYSATYRSCLNKIDAGKKIIVGGDILQNCD